MPRVENIKATRTEIEKVFELWELRHRAKPEQFEEPGQRREQHSKTIGAAMTKYFIGLLEEVRSL